MASYRCTECNAEHGALIEADECCQVNEDCPNVCHGERHDVPSERSIRNGGVATFYCPNENERWNWCDGCGEWIIARHSDNHTRVYSSWYCDPYEHDYTRCEDCSDWVHYDNVMSGHDEYDESQYCERCYNAHSREVSGSPGRCDKCRGNAPVKIHPLTEDCTCAMCEDNDAVPIDDADKA